ncbi:Spore germination protein GerKA [Desulfosporosinus sp. I2]|uniref:spore germination protein n=1 Tax=Desulfosporosinus sp. I2 TaxID=1617025 RepID=UPI0005F0AF27|nr:spore germination protein [Desulfosporosinus sp. I2]KJR44899.1 Spore germination protein GerKA [Desulfosporosinus sp. I2]
MISYILKKLRYLKLLNVNYADDQKKQGTSEYGQSTPIKLSQSLEKNLIAIRNLIGNNFDVIIREFSFGDHINVALIFLSGMTDQSMINENIMKPLMSESHSSQNETLKIKDIAQIKARILSVGGVNQYSSYDEIIDGCLSGQSILLLDECNEALAIMTTNWKSRAVEEPKTESVVRGPREGFTESLLTNTTLIRRKIMSPDLKIESMKLGSRTKTNVCIAYIQGIANPLLIEEIKRRLNRIKTDSILESGYVEQFIEDAPFSIFSTVANSEKPDAVAAKILEGRAAILVDGTPFVLSVPMVLIESFQSSEDYYSRPFFASLIRSIRFLAYFISIFAPSSYVALTTFHQELIPTPLLFSMAGAQEGVPFPAVMEAIMMGIIFEILREAGVRLPRPVGQAVSIVGALVIGESAVTAGLIGAPMVIVVALTAVSSFVVSAQSDSGGVLRITFVILAGFIGIYGIVIGQLGVFIHLASLRSFGTPYLSPLAPLSIRDLKDTIIRAPIWAMFTRPRTIGWHDPERQEFRLKPSSPSEETKEQNKAVR